MESLRTRRADTAPIADADQYYGRPPQCVTGDADLSNAAKVLYDAITLDMAIERTRYGSMATNARLAFLAGQPQGRDKGERWAQRGLGELARRGHVTVTQNRNIAGCPRLITPNAKLRGIRPRETDCTQSNLTGQDSGPPDLHPVKFDGLHPVKFDGVPRQECRGTPSRMTPPILYGENESKRQQQQDAETATNGGVRPVVVVASSCSKEDPDGNPPNKPTSIAEALADLERKLVARFPDAHPEGRARGARRRLGGNHHAPPEASRPANPGCEQPTTSPRKSEGIGSPPSSPAQEPDLENRPPTAEDFAAFRASLGLSPARVAQAEAKTGARKRPGGPTAKLPPEASRSANPGSQKPATKPAPPATPENDIGVYL